MATNYHNGKSRKHLSTNETNDQNTSNADRLSLIRLFGRGIEREGGIGITYHFWTNGTQSGLKFLMNAY